MKKIVAVLIALVSIQVAHADSTANIRIKISGAIRDNSYFLCVPGIGCLSILAGEQGKVYPIVHSIEMDKMFVTDIDHSFRLTPQGLPDSCNVTVETNHTITITGHIAATSKGAVRVDNLHCIVS